jgi:hypothetical protein
VPTEKKSVEGARVQRALASTPIEKLTRNMTGNNHTSSRHNNATTYVLPLMLRDVDCYSHMHRWHAANWTY